MQEKGAAGGEAIIWFLPQSVPTPASMRQIRPTIDELKKRYSCAMARRQMTARRHAARPRDAKVVKTPDNSEPWPPHPPRTLAECMWISDQIAKEVEKWGPKSQPTSS